jgi:hypothetical protein
MSLGTNFSGKFDSLNVISYLFAQAFSNFLVLYHEMKFNSFRVLPIL